jgi:uncharacterized protein YecT (DUF1311 family)
MKVVSPPLLFVVFCCASWSGGVLIAQTSPKGTFKIESEPKPPPPGLEGPPPQTSPKGTFKIETVYIPAEDPTTDPYEQQYVVSTADPNIREPLGDKRQVVPAEYFISPDERWIFATYHLGSHMGSGDLFKRGDGLKFAPVRPQRLAELSWRFFAEQEHMKLDDMPYSQGDEGIIDFVAWSPDSARLLVDLRGGVGDERNRGIYLWYLYFNTKTERLELTDYLRRLDKDAWKRWKAFYDEEGNTPIFPEAASAEPLAELPPETELKKRYEDADSKLNKTYNEIFAKLDKDQQTNLRDDQRRWLKTRDAGAKFYKESGGKSTPEQRYWQYMLDSTEAQLRHLAVDWNQTTEAQ